MVTRIGAGAHHLRARQEVLSRVVSVSSSRFPGVCRITRGPVLVGRYLFYSHDGYGLGHVRRNSVIARAVLATDPAAQVSLVTGIEVRPRWLRQAARVRVHRVPPMLKSANGSYR